MQAHGSVSLLDLLDLPDAQREILLYVTRNGPADGAALVLATGLPTAEVEQTLEALVEIGHVRRPADGRLDTIADRWPARYHRRPGQESDDASRSVAACAADHGSALLQTGPYRFVFPPPSLKRASGHCRSHGSGRTHVRQVARRGPTWCRLTT